MDDPIVTAPMEKPIVSASLGKPIVFVPMEKQVASHDICAPIQEVYSATKTSTTSKSPSAGDVKMQDTLALNSVGPCK